MFELTNEQRKCFALPLVLDNWERVEVIQSRNDYRKTVAYLEGNIIRKLIVSSDDCYVEQGLNEKVSDDKRYLMPKTEKGKPKLLTSSSINNCIGVGMGISYCQGSITIYNRTTEQDYYKSLYDEVELSDLDDFMSWVEKWCAETTEKDIKDIQEFASRERVHIKYKEGDFFRFKINRKLYGYGRIMLNFGRMRKEKIPFWDMFYGIPLCVGIYHIATERTDVTIEELQAKKMLPTQMIMDNIFYYGDCEIIGNRELSKEEEDFPIHYGRSHSVRENCVNYQCGYTFLSLECEKELYPDFKNNGIGYYFHVRLPILLKCIEEDSNLPYWNQMNMYSVNKDLRNPKFSNELKEIRNQFGL